MVQLDPRKREILRAVINEYIATAEPVGSETVASRYNLGISPATVRNEMAALEEMGYLRQPYTSAGRVPTDRAYRLYVDTLVEEERELPSLEKERLRRRVRLSVGEPGEAVEEAARALAMVTEYASIVAEPRPEHGVFKHLHLIPLSDTEAIAVIITDTGVIEGKVVQFSDGFSPDELDRLSRHISRRLEGYPLGEITDRLLAQIIQEAVRHQRAIQQLKRVLRKSLWLSLRARVYIEGTANILLQPEFQDIRRVRPLLSMLEQEEVIQDLLSEAVSRGLLVVIGSENRYAEMQACSVIAACYRVGGRPAGAVGIIGPTRMPYGKVIPTVQFLAESLGEVLTRLMHPPRIS